MAQTPHMALDLLEQSQAQKEVTMNEALFRLDAVLNSGALDRGLDNPPTSPAEGDVYIVGATPTGDWSGKAEHLAYFHQLWRFIEPNAGLLIWVVDEAAHYVFNGSSWVAAAVSGGGGGGGSGDMAKAAYDGANINQQLVGVSAAQTLTNKTINASNNTLSNISLTSSVTGTLPLANGGTGLTVAGSSGNVLTSNGTAWVSQPPAGGGSSVLSFRNLIINGDFRINQRDLTSVADDTYHLDRWYALTQSGNVTIAQQSDQENGQPHNMRMTQPDVSAKRIGVAQIVEGKNCKHLRGSLACVSARVRCSVSQAIRYAILEWTGTEDSVTSDVVNNWTSTSFTAGGFFNSPSLVVVATGSITPAANTWVAVEGHGTVSGAAHNLIVMFWSEGALAQSATLDIGLVQLEQASAATVFEYRAQEEVLASCLRYFPTIIGSAGNNAMGIFAHAVTSTIARLSFMLPVTPRVKPTGITVSNVSHFNLPVASTGYSISAMSFDSGQVNTVNISATTSGITAGGFYILLSNNSSAYIWINGCEL